MAQQALINGTNYQIGGGGKPLINGTSYKITGGRTLVGATGYDVKFKYSEYVLKNGEFNSDIAEVLYAWTRGIAYGAVLDSGGQYVDYSAAFSGNGTKLFYTETVSGGTGTRFIATSYGNTPNFVRAQGFIVVPKGEWTKIRLKALPSSTATISFQLFGAGYKSTSPPWYSGWTQLLNTTISCSGEVTPVTNIPPCEYYAISLPSEYSQVVEYMILEE